MLLKGCTQYVSKYGKLSSGQRTGKASFHSCLKERRCQTIFKLPYSSVQSLSCVWLFVTPWTAASQVSLFIINSWSLLKFMFIESVMPSNRLIFCHPLLLLPSIVPRIRVFTTSYFFTSSGHNIGASASASVLPMNIQDWLPLGWTGWISLKSKGLFSSTTIQKHQFFRAQLSLQSNSHNHTWLLEKSQLWLDGPLLAK